MSDVVAKARALMERLPPRPWSVWRGHPSVFSLVQEQSRGSITSEKGGGRIVDFDGYAGSFSRAMGMRLARYFAASPAVIEALCAEVERLRAGIAQAVAAEREACAKMCDARALSLDAEADDADDPDGGNDLDEADALRCARDAVGELGRAIRARGAS